MESSKKFTDMLYRVMFLGIGVIMALQVYDNVLQTSGDAYLAVLSMAITLSFWIGTLTVIWKIILKKKLF